MTDRLDTAPPAVLGDPLRVLPLPVFLRALLGGMVSQMGWAILGFGMIFVWVFVVHIDFSGAARLLVRQATARGQVIAVDESGFSEGGDDDSAGAPIERIAYRFSGPGGRIYEGVSYSAEADLRPGDTVRIEYAVSNPESSRIQGLRQAPIPMLALFILVLPLAGLGMVVYSLMEGVKAVQLLRGGRIAPATLVSSEGTNLTVNNRPVIRLTFEFTDQDGGLHEVVTRSTSPHLLQDQAEELVLYDPREPRYAAMLDAMPGSPRMGASGQLQIDSTATAFLLLILPAATLLGHGLYLLMRYVFQP